MTIRINPDPHTGGYAHVLLHAVTANSPPVTTSLVPVVYWMLYRGSDQSPDGESVTLVPVSEPSH